MKNVVHVLFLGSIFLLSCTTTKPTTSSRTKQSDGIYKFNNPEYLVTDNKTTIGLLNVAAMAGGGYYGYQSDYDIQILEDQTGPNKYVNATIGALTGYIAMKMTTGLFAKKSGVRDIKRPESWVKNIDKSLIYVPGSYNSSSLIAVESRLEKDFNLKSLGDLQLYNRMFNNSKFRSQVIANSLSGLNRYKIEEILESGISLGTNKTAYQSKYITLSSNLESFISSSERYPNVISDRSIKAIDYIESIKDVKLYVSTFGNSNPVKVKTHAKKMVSNASELAVFHEVYNDLMETDNLILKLIDKNTSTIGKWSLKREEEIAKLIADYPNSAHIQKLNYRYLALSENVKELLSKKISKRLLGLEKSSYNLSDPNDVIKIILSIQKNKENLTTSDAKRLITTTQDQYLKKVYNKTTYEDDSQNQFIEYVNDNKKWLGTETCEKYLSKAKNRLKKNKKEREILENELDDIYRYVGLDGQYMIDEQDGDDLSLWQSLWSSNVSTENRNVFLSGKMKNYGKKSKKIKITGTVNIRKKEKSMWGSKNNLIKQNGDFFMILEPGESKQFVIMTKYTNKAKNESHFLWGENSYNVFIDRDDPAELEIEYWEGSISQSTMEEQSNLVNAYRSSGNITKKETSWENNYMRSDYATKSEIEFEYGDWTTGGWFSDLPAECERGRKVKFQCPQDSKRPGTWISEYVGVMSNGNYRTGVNVCGLFSSPKFETFEEAMDKTVECSCY